MAREYKNLWHVGGGYGNELPEGTTVAQIVKKSGLDFTVEKHPLMAVLPNPEDEENPFAVECPGKFATVRTDTNTVLGVVGNDYQIGQNELAWTIPQILEDEGKFTVQSAGVFKGGAHVMLTGKVATESIRLQNGKEDVLSQMLVFSNGHHGKKSLVMGFTHFRHACSNQNLAIMRGLTAEHKIRHTGNLEIRVAEAHEEMLVAEKALAKGRKMFQAMADAKMTKAGFKKFARELLDAVAGSHKDDGTRDARHSEEARTAQIDELTKLFGEGQGNYGVSLWDGYNSITEWLDHKLDGVEKTKDNEKRFQDHYASMHFGRSSVIKRRAVQLLMNR